MLITEFCFPMTLIRVVLPLKVWDALEGESEGVLYPLNPKVALPWGPTGTRSGLDNRALYPLLTEGIVAKDSAYPPAWGGPTF